METDRISEDITDVIATLKEHGTPSEVIESVQVGTINTRQTLKELVAELAHEDGVKRRED